MENDDEVLVAPEARWRVGPATGAAVAAVAAVAIVLVWIWDRPASPVPTPAAFPATSHRPSGSPTGVADPVPVEEQLAALLHDPDAMLGSTTFDGALHSVSTLRKCGNPDGICTMSVLLTDDGWRDGVARFFGEQTHMTWTHLLPDGSAAVVPDDPEAAVVLHPDGSTSHLRVTTKPVAANDGTLLTDGPVSADPEGTRFGYVWVLDPEDDTLAPLVTQPPGPPAGGPPLRTPGGDYVVPRRTDGVPLELAISSDGGRHWLTREVPGPTDDQAALSDVAVGPDGRIAVKYTFDGATLAPWRELWLSVDMGRSWRLVPAEHHPRTVSGMAYAPDGTLLLTDDQNGQMWRVSRDGQDLERAFGMPSAVVVTATGGVLVAQIDGRSFAMSDDGVAWWHVNPGYRFTVETDPNSGTPLPID